MFREPEKSPGLLLLRGAGPQQLQLPGPAPPPPRVLPPQGACVCACVCDGEPPRTPAVRLSVRVCCPGQDGHSLEPWRPSRDRQDAVQEPPPPRPYRRTTPGHGWIPAFRKVSPWTVGPEPRVPLGSGDRGLGAADEQGDPAMLGLRVSLGVSEAPLHSSAGSGLFPHDSALQAGWFSWHTSQPHQPPPACS